LDLLCIVWYPRCRRPTGPRWKVGPRTTGFQIQMSSSPEPADSHRFGPAGHPGPCPFRGCGYTPRSSALNPDLNLWNHVIVTVSAMILQLPSRQFQGRLSATSGALVDGTIVALSFAAAPPRAQAGTAIAARTTLSTWSRTRRPKERRRSPLMRLRCRPSPSSQPRRRFGLLRRRCGTSTTTTAS
jgi:hypothetical protein